MKLAIRRTRRYLAGDGYLKIIKKGRNYVIYYRGHVIYSGKMSRFQYRRWRNKFTIGRPLSRLTRSEANAIEIKMIQKKEDRQKRKYKK